MKKLQSILIQYRLVIYLLYPLIFIITFFMAARTKDWRYFRERLGIYHKVKHQSVVWIHAASVGEVNSVIPLIRAMVARAPQQIFILTTATPTGGLVARKQLPENAYQFYLPVDTPGATRRFLKKMKPKCAIIMETELWANLYFACDNMDIPITIINARLSNKTLQTNAWMYRLYAETLSHVKKILARSNFDADAFMTIGASSSKIKVIGNIKLAYKDVGDASRLKDLPESYFLAASTHENEEEKISAEWVKHNSKQLLVIAPRHPKRIAEIEKKISNITDRYAVRSRGESINENTQIYIADTLGEMQDLIYGADAVFMGGSLVPIGGHNVIEVVRYGKPVFFGPHMDNFIEERDLLLNREIGKQVKDAEELVNKVLQLTCHTQQMDTIRKNSIQLVQEHSDILDRYIEAINEPLERYIPNRIIN
ncbi:MAG: 3-deoxy-D-manno-octulosonic acid transferase [Gammaproteobacteria bacterium]|nr:3-deoxy-D-manno-octulosonic acid transferase [Gammaproteobacteria bacterium]